MRRYRFDIASALLCSMACLLPLKAHSQSGTQKPPVSQKGTPPAAGTQTPPKGKEPPPPAEPDTKNAKPMVLPPPKNGEDTTIAGIACSVWKPKTPGPWPLVIFSHGYHGSSQQSTFLTVALADHGYLVIAPNHRDSYRFGVANAGLEAPQASFAHVRTWNSTIYKDRGDDIHRLVAALKQNETYKKSIDWNKVALAGHSLGGYTVLGLGGAWKGWYLPEVKAIIALSPYAAPFIQANTLTALSVPVLYQGGTLDVGISPLLKVKGGVLDKTPAPAYYIEFSRAGHFAWTDLNPAFQPEIIEYCEKFLDKYLKPASDIDLTKQSKSVSYIRYKDKKAVPSASTTKPEVPSKKQQ
jgi:predicted dienelactone hydrolase